MLLNSADKYTHGAPVNKSPESKIDRIYLFTYIYKMQILIFSFYIVLLFFINTEGSTLTLNAKKSEP